MTKYIWLFVSVGIAVVVGMVAARNGFSFQRVLGVADWLVLAALVLLTAALAVIGYRKRSGRPSKT